MPKTTPLETAIRTDTATLAVFDALRLKHRLTDDPDWWSIPEDEVNEINSGSKATKGRYAAQYALDGYSWPSQVKKMVDLYKQALTG